MSLYDAAYFAKINAEESPQAERLADILCWHYQPKSVIDIGCASGLYLKPFLDRGVKVVGIDYSEAVIDKEVLQIPRKFIKIVDITKEQIKQQANLAICIEVLEHIDKKGAKAAVKNITKASETIFFTAAQPGQGGVGHVNCQPKEYWQKLFKDNGFERDVKDEDYIRILIQSGYHMGWLAKNLMVFKKTS